jgi:hypothetical protein
MNVADDTVEEVFTKTAERKIMSDKKLYYYRIFDDKERLNYLKSSLPHDKVEHWLKEYERTHQKYFNPEFISFLHEHDREAEIIEVSDISY